MRGAPAKPTALKLLEGTLRKDRTNPNEPKGGDPVGPPGKTLTAEEKKCYRELVKNCHEKVLCSADKFAVEQAAILLHRCRTHKATVNEQKLFQNYLTHFGMTPASRSKVSAGATAEKEADPWKDYRGGKRG